MEPEEGWSNPATIRRNVDFPHPDGPTMTQNDPGLTVRLTSMQASTWPLAVVNRRPTCLAMTPAPASMTGAVETGWPDCELKSYVMMEDLDLLLTVKECERVVDNLLVDHRCRIDGAIEIHQVPVGEEFLQGHEIVEMNLAIELVHGLD